MTPSPHRSLGPFKLDCNGLLSPATPETFPCFAVRWRNRLVHARMRQKPSGDGLSGTLDLIARLGRVPSTASQATGPAHRSASLAALRRLPRLMPKGWRLQLLADHSVLVETELPLTLPVSAVGLVTELTMFLLTLTPYLEVLDAEGVSAGMAKTWPG